MVVEDNSEIARVKAYCGNRRVTDFFNYLKALLVLETQSKAQYFSYLVVKLKLVDNCPRFNVFDYLCFNVL